MRLAVSSRLLGGVGRAGQSARATLIGRASGTTPGACGTRTLDQINRENVARLKPAWTYHTGELEADGDGKTIECTPIVVDGVMYVTTGASARRGARRGDGRGALAVRPAQGSSVPHEPTSGGVNRGCAYWSDGKAGRRAADHPRHVGRAAVLARCEDGQARPGVRRGGRPRPARRSSTRTVASLGYGPTSAPAIWKDTIIVGVSCGEGPGIAAPGDMRAFDVRTGKQLWRFHTVPRPGEFGHDTWKGESWKNRGGANAWGGLSVDAERGLVFAGLGSAAFDFYGGDRHGENLFANCTIALDAETGKRVWHFQTLRHDLWDHDLPAYPNLVTVTHDGRRDRRRGAGDEDGLRVSVRSRDGQAAVRDRGASRVPASDVPGEQAWPTQPIPVKPPPFSVQSFDETNVTDIGAANRESVLAQLQEGSRRAGVQPAEPAGDGRHSRLPRRGELVGGVVRPDDRAALRQLEQRAEHHHAGRSGRRRRAAVRRLSATRATSSSSTTRATRRSSRRGGC